MNKKAQAALEFIMNYGWMILVIFILLAGLSYMGLLKPTNLLPDKCVASPGINCIDYKLENNTYTFLLSQTTGNRILNATINISTEENCNAGLVTITDWNDAEQELVVFSCQNPQAKDYVKGDLEITYFMQNKYFKNVAFVEFGLKNN